MYAYSEMFPKTHLLRNPWSGPYACLGAQNILSVAPASKAANIMDLSTGLILTPQALPKISMAWAGLSRMKWKAESDLFSHSLTAAASRLFSRESRSLET